MVVVTTPLLQSKFNLHQIHSPFPFKSSPFLLLHVHHCCKNPLEHIVRASPSCKVGANNNGVLSVKAYIENPNSVSSLVSKVVGSLPVIGLFARIFSDEGGVGGDVIDFAEFRRRVGKKCTVMDSASFYEFQERRGKAGDPLYVLLCCWLAAIGAGLLKSEEILEGVARLRLSNDIEFEEENFLALLRDAKEGDVRAYRKVSALYYLSMLDDISCHPQRRAKLRVETPSIPLEIRAEKALEAIYVCCFGKDPIENEDERLLSAMLNAVFPSVGLSEIERIVSEKVKRIAEGGEINNLPEPKPLPQEAIRLQMKDLQFLKQNSEN
ncbi:hypothetical protein Sjap_023631 [Stephania japonica]|uniref:Photosystem I assembly factor PSA3, chloroplastic n=1 Tax=Stephania japonica TaxID=461633 RepID=A0AAP0EC05_9MAGN